MNYEDWKKWPDDKFMQYTHREAIYFRMICRRFSIPRNANLLEIGFGNGGLLGYMRQTGRQVSGIETNPTLINRAIQAGVKCFDQLADIPEDCFDVVILMDVLEHIDQAAIPEFFKELERITKQGGRVVIRSPNGHSPLGLSNQHGDVTHVTVITIPKVDFWLRRLKLGIIYSGWDLPELSLSSPFRSIRNIAMLLLARFAEKIIRIVFRPQPAGLLSANLLIVLERFENDVRGQVV